MIIGNDKYMMVENANSSYSVQMKLVIRKFNNADLGGYKCISKNSIGDAEGTIRLYEMELPRRKSDNYEENELGEHLYDGHQGSLREDTGEAAENNEVPRTENENKLSSNCDRPSSMLVTLIIPFVLCLMIVL